MAKAAVFAVGDPWFYNEYTDGRKLPPEYDNFKAANDLVSWLVKQISSNKKIITYYNQKGHDIIKI
jgi:unsaturated rhamnogalacturonyl hydrolase